MTRKQKLSHLLYAAGLCWLDGGNKTVLPCEPKVLQPAYHIGPDWDHVAGEVKRFATLDEVKQFLANGGCQ
jgi:hypothetical protein